ncbi:MAG: thiamine phosphate synthase [Firmicutes bacterium]|nr:thiamine phosphate synthase [Bacillota bacterium]
MQLYAVTDRAWTGKQTLMQQVEAAIKGGATMVQLREKTLDRESFFNEAVEMRKLCSRYGIPFIVNDDIEIAIACGADGVHVGQEDLEAGKARKLLGKSRIIGVSAKTPEQARAAQAAGADYLGCGAMFATSTKINTSCIGPEALKAVCAAVDIPVCAIGGITKENMPLLAGSGADGAALVSAIFGAADIEAECRRLLALSKEVFEL